MDDDPRDRRHYVAVAAVVALVLVGAGVFVGTFVLSVGESAVIVVRADAAIESAPSNVTGAPGSVTITWTENGDPPDGGGFLETEKPTHAEHLTVQWAATDGSTPVDDLETGHAERNVTVTDGAWRLGAVGRSVTLSERDPTRATTVRIVVTAHRDEMATVILAKAVTL